MANNKIQEQKEEFIGQIIDIFEDFLDEKGCDIENEERNADDEPISAIIYRSDYDALSDRLTSMMTNWGILKKEEAAA